MISMTTPFQQMAGSIIPKEGPEAGLQGWNVFNHTDTLATKLVLGGSKDGRFRKV